MSHTKEPWELMVHESEQGRTLVKSAENSVFVAAFFGSDKGESEGNAERSILCVNACAGLTDPEKQIKLLVVLSRDLFNLKRIKMNFSEQDYRDELRRRLENLEDALKPFKEL